MRKINFIIILLLSSICCFGQGASASSINRRATLFLNKRVGIKDYKIGKPDYTCIKMKDSISSFFLGKVDTVSIDKVTIDLKVSILGDTILYSVSNEEDLLLNKFCDPYTSLGIGLPDSLQNKSLIVCYDKNKALIHMAFYYNNSFYSKNGGGVLHTVYKRFSDIKRHYPEIKYIRTYKIKAQYQK